MPADVQCVYQQALESLRHASDFRAKIIGGWSAVFTAFAGIFAWFQANFPGKSQGLKPSLSDSTLISLFFLFILIGGLLLNRMLWAADCRNRAAIKRAKEIGEAIETDPGNAFEEKLRFFGKLNKSESHSSIIDRFYRLSSGLFLLAAGATIARLFVK